MSEFVVIEHELSYPVRRTPNGRERFDGETWVRIPYLRPEPAKPKRSHKLRDPDKPCEKGHLDWEWSDRHDGNYVCLECRREYKRAWRAAGRERMRARRADAAAHARELELAKARREAGYIRPSRRAA